MNLGPYRGAPLQRTEDPALQRFLQDDERVLWVGRPGPPVGRTSLPHFFASGTIMAAMGVWMTWQAGANGAAFSLVGITAILAGLGVLAVQDARRRPRTVYAVTDRRVLVVDTAADRPEEDVPFAQLPKPKIGAHNTIHFGGQRVRLEDLADAAEVHAILIGAIAGSRLRERR